MIVEVKMNFIIDDDAYERFKRFEHHLDFLVNLNAYPEIHSVFGVEVNKI